MRQRVTLSDVAKKSGVSISTVSLVLRNKPGIPPGTRQRVLDAVKKLNYKPKSSMARHYAAHSPLRTLGLVIKSEPDMPPRANPFYSHVMAGIEDACRQRKINLLYSMLPVNGNNHPVQVARLPLEGGVEGLLVVGAFVDSALAPVLEQGAVPIVLVDAYAESGRYEEWLSSIRASSSKQARL
jgi:LacI family transcriptional regulator